LSIVAFSEQQANVRAAMCFQLVAHLKISQTARHDQRKPAETEKAAAAKPGRRINAAPEDNGPAKLTLALERGVSRERMDRHRAGRHAAARVVEQLPSTARAAHTDL